MKILIGGGSWGLGEWCRTDLRGNIGIPNINHGGLAQFLQEAGHNVVNVSIPGGSNTTTHSSLSTYLSAQSLKNQESPDLILVFQTEYTRDYPFRFEEDYNNLVEANDLAHIFLSRFYSRLSDIAKLYQVPVGLIGGCSDTLSGGVLKHYDGVEIACQSMINLIVNNESSINIPVLSWYDKNTRDLVNELKKILSPTKFSDLLDQIDLGVHRQNILSMNPEYFWPDGVHANREGHKKLYDFLCGQKLFG